jgi:hypothetical protein
MIAIMIIRVITAIIIDPTTLSVTPPNPPGIPNRCYVTLYAAFRLVSRNKRDTSYHLLLEGLCCLTTKSN